MLGFVCSEDDPGCLTVGLATTNLDRKGDLKAAARKPICMGLAASVDDARHTRLMRAIRKALSKAQWCLCPDFDRVFLC